MSKKKVTFEILPDGNSKGETLFWKFAGKQTRTKGLSFRKAKAQICKLVNEALERDGSIVMHAKDPVGYFLNLAENLQGEDISKLAKILRCDPTELKLIMAASRKQINNQLKKAGINPELEARLAWAGF